MYYPYPQTPFPRERLCMLCWLCIVLSLWAYTPGVRAGAECGATAPDQARMLAVSRTKPLHDAVAQMADDLYGGYAPATPFSENTKVYRQSEIRTSKRGAYCFIFTFTLPLSSASVFLLHRAAALWYTGRGNFFCRLSLL